MTPDLIILAIRLAFAGAFLFGLYLLAAAWVRVTWRARAGRRVRV